MSRERRHGAAGFSPSDASSGDPAPAQRHGHDRARDAGAGRAPYPLRGPGAVRHQTLRLLFESVDALRPNEVYIASGGPTYTARLGDMLTLRARKLGAAGVVLNAHVRDAKNILA